MAGLFDGVVQENPLFVDNSEKYAKRAELARDEAVKSEVEAGNHASSALNQAAIAKGHADRAERVKGEVDVVASTVNKDKIEVLNIKNEVKADKILIDQIVLEGKVLGNKFDADKVEIEGMKNTVSTDAAKTKTYRDQAEGFSKTSEGFSNTARSFSEVASGHSRDAKVYRDQASTHSSNASKAQTDAANSAQKAKTSENTVISVIGNAENVLNSANLTLLEVKNTQTRVEGFQGEVIVARDEAEVSREGALMSEQMAKVSEGKAKDYETGSEEYYNLVKDLYTDMKEGIVYRGTWNPKTGAYPNALDTNSAWDVITGQSDGVSFDGEMWFAGDKVIYAKEDKKYYHLASASAVQSVNGKTGAVVLTPADIGAITTNEVYTKTEIDASNTIHLTRNPHNGAYESNETNKANFWFSSLGKPTNEWYSGFTFKPWDSGYLGWEMFAKSGSSTNENKIYCKTGKGGDWDKVAEVYTSLNLPTKLSPVATAVAEECSLTWVGSDGTVGGDTSNVRFNPATGNARFSKGYIYAQQGFYDQGHMVYSPRNKPTAAELGVLPSSGGDVTGGFGIKRGLSVGSVTSSATVDAGDIWQMHAGNPRLLCGHGSGGGNYGGYQWLSGDKTFHLTHSGYPANSVAWFGADGKMSVREDPVEPLGVANKRYVDSKVASATVGPNLNLDGELTFKGLHTIKGGAANSLNVEAGQFAFITAGKGQPNSAVYIGSNAKYDGAWSKFDSSVQSCVMELNGSTDLVYYHSPAGNPNPIVSKHSIYTSLNKPTAADVGALSNAGGDVNGRIAADGFDVVGNAGVRYVTGEGGAPYNWATGAEPSNGTWVMNRYKDGFWQNSPIKVEGSTGDICLYGGVYVNDQKVYHRGDKPTASDVGAVPNTGGSVSGRLSATTLASDEVDMGAFTISRSANKLQFLV